MIFKYDFYWKEEQLSSLLIFYLRIRSLIKSSRLVSKEENMGVHLKSTIGKSRISLIELPKIFFFCEIGHFELLTFCPILLSLFLSNFANFFVCNSIHFFFSPYSSNITQKKEILFQYGDIQLEGFLIWKCMILNSQRKYDLVRISSPSNYSYKNSRKVAPTPRKYPT